MYIAAVGAKGEANIHRLAAELRELGEEGHRIVGRDELARLLGTAHYRAALYTPSNILMQPGKLVRGLADALPANVTLAEESPAIAFEAGRRILVRTPEGEVAAEKAILAVNAFAPQFGFFEKAIFPVALHVTLTRPLTPAELKAIGSPKPWGIIPAVHAASPTMRLTNDFRIMTRAGYALSSDHMPSERARRRSEPHHRRLIRDRFPALADIAFEHSWTGFVCASRNRAHGLGNPAPNVFTAVCENGVGATKSTVSGICAADMAAGEWNPLADDLLSFGEPRRVPRSPFFEIGFHAKRRYEAWRDRAEM
jgi:glycine/D-amino acid oxidase-like deaminating enzyme